MIITALSKSMNAIEDSTLLQQKRDKYLCGQCSHQSTSSQHLAHHKKTVHDVNKYPCEQCQYQATKKEYLYQHKRSVHDGIKYTCEEC